MVGWTQLDSLLSIIREFTQQIPQLESVIESTAIDLKETKQLMTSPGVSFCALLLIIAEIGEIDRFHAAEPVASFTGPGRPGVGLNP